MADELVCNYRKCRKKITGYGWVTSCSHIFCDDDGSREFAKSYTCPACETNLSGKADIIRMDLNPSEQYKSMVLSGLRPETVLETASRAISFWMYQISQEKIYYEFLSSRSKERSHQVEHYYEQILTRTKSELDTLRNKVSTYKKEIDEWRKKYHSLQEEMMEKKRQYQKLQTMYDALRRKHINPKLLDCEPVMHTPVLNKGPSAFSFSLGTGEPGQENFIVPPDLNSSFNKRHQDRRTDRGDGDGFVMKPQFTPQFRGSEVSLKEKFDDNYSFSLFSSPSNAEPGHRSGARHKLTSRSSPTQAGH